ncbi:hypothetical protein [Arcticibacterium luteifluviistationis]|uniref:Serine kinase n=1 Tax=Arcticibacterium luteifluviistationis TaxID=1784714 RepID=A0A2Z4GG61_9BACT|nr:hypothetical protein [Arcticibacterium luteifluviistationis]AWV99988.1 hypothetical protein DJ013_18180 [Arcticibacterium luteifluviistationis]
MLNQLFVDEILERFQSIGVSDSKTYEVGEILFTVDYFGFGEQDNFSKAISHLVSDETDGEFYIYVSDMENGGLNLPKPSWDWDELDQNGFIPTVDSTRFVARFMSWQNCFYLVDLVKRRAFFWIKDYREMPEWERSFPFRDIFHHVFNSLDDYAIVHAAAVGNVFGGVLMPGRGGSGKSTAALSCLDSDLLYAGDDLVLVNFKTQYIYSLYNVAKLEENHISIFPKLRPHIYNAEALPKEKAQIFLNDFWSEKMAIKMSFLGVVLPKYLGSEDTSFKESNVAKALMALAPSSMGLLKTDVSYLNKLSRLLKDKKVMELSTGKDLKQIPESINIIIKILND